jgi:hypothetical protein
LPKGGLKCGVPDPIGDEGAVILDAHEGLKFEGKNRGSDTA